MICNLVCNLQDIILLNSIYKRDIPYTKVNSIIHKIIPTLSLI